MLLGEVLMTLTMTSTNRQQCIGVQSVAPVLQSAAVQSRIRTTNTKEADKRTLIALSLSFPVIERHL